MTDGSTLLGQEEGITFFASALIEALDKNGYFPADDGWVVQPLALNAAVDANLRLACQAAQIPDSMIPQVDGRTPDPSLALHYRDANNPPTFLVKMTCKPEGHNARYSLSYGLKDSDERIHRDPNAAAWYCHLVPGFYRFEAVSTVGEGKRHKEQYVAQHLVEVYLKEVV